MLGCLFSFIVFSLIVVFVIVGIITASVKDSDINLQQNSILYLTLDHPILERGTNNPFREADLFSMSPSKAIGLNEIIAAIDAAAEEEKISAIFIEPSLMQNAGMATIEEIRDALIRFKKSGKPIIAYSEVYTQKSYYLASVADKIYINPKGMFDFRGFASELYFLKGTLSKLEIEAQIIRHGKYKSAVEPFTNEQMSDENREQYTELLTSMWNAYLKNIADARGIDIATLNTIADSAFIRNAEDAVNYGFVDEMMYKDQVLEILKVQSGSESDIDKLESVTLHQYAKSITQQSTTFDKNKIAVIYANGEIGSGKGDDFVIGSETTSQAIRNARLDEDVKAIVLRVNSPGGSALASEVIWREVKLTAEVKPVVVSMGDLAASGGYYIACPATKIVAQPSTITGSIGVFGVIFNMGEFFKNKLGVTFDVVKTNEYADMMTMTRPLTQTELALIQFGVEEIYDTFIQRVAEGRNLSIEDVEQIAQGRVWSGLDAKEIGLVDEIGNLGDAINIAAELAGLESYMIVEMPKQKEFLEEIFSDMLGNNLMAFFTQSFYKAYPFLRSIEPVQSHDAFQTRLEFDLVIN